MCFDYLIDTGAVEGALVEHAEVFRLNLRLKRYLKHVSCFVLQLHCIGQLILDASKRTGSVRTDAWITIQFWPGLSTHQLRVAGRMIVSRIVFSNEKTTKFGNRSIFSSLAIGWRHVSCCVVQHMLV